MNLEAGQVAMYNMDYMQYLTVDVGPPDRLQPELLSSGMCMYFKRFYYIFFSLEWL